MPNQTPHTPQNQTPFPTGRGLGWGLQMKAPIFPSELLERFKQTKAMTFSEKTVKEVNELLTQAELKKQQQNQTRQFTGNLEALEISWLEQFNFQVDSSNWWYELDKDWKQKLLNWHPIKENPKKDIWEITMQDWTKEQLFTHDSAIREIQKAWKTIPTWWEWWQWEQICKPYWDDWEKLSKELWLPMAGYRSFSGSSFNYQSSDAYYWSSSPSSTNAYGLYINTTAVLPANIHYSAYGFSVRCIKN